MRKIIVRITAQEICDLITTDPSVFCCVKVEGDALLVRLWRLNGKEECIGLDELPDTFDTQPGEEIVQVSLRRARELLNQSLSEAGCMI